MVFNALTLISLVRTVYLQLMLRFSKVFKISSFLVHTVLIKTDAMNGTQWYANGVLYYNAILHNVCGGKRCTTEMYL